MQIKNMKERIRDLAGRAGLYLSSYSNRQRVADVLEISMLAAPTVAFAAIASCDPKDVFGVYGNIADFFNLHTISDAAQFLKDNAAEFTDFKGSLINRLAAAMPAIPAYASLCLENTLARFPSSRRIDNLSAWLIEYSRR